MDDSKDDNKKRWKKEAHQLKQDLDNRKKVIKKREVQIKFPKNQSIGKSNSASQGSNKINDDHFRDSINFI